MRKPRGPDLKPRKRRGSGYHINRRSMPPEQRFWAKVDKGDGSGCWLWTAGTYLGYGSFQTHSRRGSGGAMLAHRYSWVLAHGPIPVGMNVCHTCDNPPCVRPEHLFLGTQADNMRDMTRKGRHGSPASSLLRGGAKLTEDDVRAIRRQRSAGVSTMALGQTYGVGRGTIHRIGTRQTWATVTDTTA